MTPPSAERESTECPAVVAALVVDCADPSSVAAFWQGLLGGEVVNFPEYDVVALRAPGVTFDFVRVSDAKSTKNRWHLDVATHDPGETRRRVEELGGSAAPDVSTSDRFTVMRDVEHNEFCVMHYAVDGPWVPPESPG